ncbi:type I secretion system permease/ATPase [Flaviflagellibacter deserti]|uniref:Type I secretion system permease/ATPase n=1 Tax=Flaviflagellibacter deserti TaxID=2267266 RepID=A0ABV9Z6E2_9HYPH
MGQEGNSHLPAALMRFKGGLVGVAVLSGLINILMLTGSLFMLAVYDRVLPSRSIPTLIALGGIALFMYAFQGFLEIIRARILSRVGIGFEEDMAPDLLGEVVSIANARGPQIDAVGPMKDLETLRVFMGSPGPIAIFDLPWLPVFLAVCFAYHFIIGITVLSAAVVLAALTLAAELFARRRAERSHRAAMARNNVAEETRRGAEAIHALGMTAPMIKRWRQHHQDFLRQHTALSDFTSLIATASKSLRMILQSLILAIGAYLVINQEATGGIMIASSILVSRALAPIDLAIGQWRSFVSARQAWARLSGIVANATRPSEVLSLPAPYQTLEVQNISVSPPGSGRLAVHDISFSLESGDALGIIGASGCGKSTLARALAGVWQPVRGTIRLDGIPLQQWPPAMLSSQVGYLPQDVCLMEGNVARNISRFHKAQSEEVLEAAGDAHVHELIATLPNGYQTNVGPNGSALSAGQRQRVGLARAMFRRPFLIILDEPNSNLDTSGEVALSKAILRARAWGSIVIIVAHRPNVISNVNKILYVADDGQSLFGDREAVLNRVLQHSPISIPERADA